MGLKTQIKKVLKIVAIGDAIVSDTSFSTLGWIESGPGDLFTFKAFNFFSISVVVIKILFKTSLKLALKGGEGESPSSTKTLEKNSLRTFAFSESFSVTDPSSLFRLATCSLGLD